MKKFNQGSDRKFSGSGDRGFDNKRSGGGRPDFGSSAKFSATCTKCGHSCEVPFKPISGKPVLCSDCFKTNNGTEKRPNDRGDRNDRSFSKPSFGDRNSSRSSFGEEKRMFSAVCSKCGDSCELPFKPSGERPVFCSNCFSKESEGNDSPRRESGQKEDRALDYKFEAINSKLDAILIMLNTKPTLKEEKVEAEVKEVKKEKVAKKAVKIKKEDKRMVKKASKKVTKK